eukprot:Sdes_comp10280_c0_seq1m1913
MYSANIILDHQLVTTKNNCMYTLKPIYPDLSSLDTFAGLAKKQQEILQRSTDLKTLFESFTLQDSSSPNQQQCSPLHISIVASVENPPYATFSLLKNSKNVLISIHRHCSVPQTTGVSFAALPSNASLQQTPSLAKFKVSILWKAVDLSECRPTAKTVIAGDSNICRYICRHFFPHLYPENQNPWATSQIDHILDFLSNLSKLKPKEISNHLKNINVTLGSSPHLSGPSPTIADIAFLAYVESKEEFSKLAAGYSNIKKWLASRSA